MLLGSMVALTLLFSVVSTVNPSYFAGLSAYAEHEERNDKRSNYEEHNGANLVQTLGSHSKVGIKTDNKGAELGVKVLGGDLKNGTYSIEFSCTSPLVSKNFTNDLVVERGQGEFRQGLALENGAYSGCEVTVGTLSAEFPAFTILTHEEERDQYHNGENNSRVRLDKEENSIGIEVEIAGLNMTNGMYNATFTCEAPALNVTLDNALKVYDGEGKVKVELGLANSTYTGCELVIAGTDTVIASFDSFTLAEEVNDDNDVKEKRKEKSERIASTVTGSEIHERHRKAHAESPGEYAPSSSFTLSANGTAMNNGTKADSEVNMDLAVWKSNRAIVLLDVVGGTVDVGNRNYTVLIGYALYSMNHNAMKIASLAVDEDGNIMKLKLRGSAIDDESTLPKDSGSVDLMFEGSTGTWNSTLGDWKLELEGTLTA